MTLPQLTLYALSLTNQDRAIATKACNIVEKKNLTGWNRRAVLLVGVRE